MINLIPLIFFIYEKNLIFIQILCLQNITRKNTSNVSFLYSFVLVCVFAAETAAFPLMRINKGGSDRIISVRVSRFSPELHEDKSLFLIIFESAHQFCFSVKLLEHLDDSVKVSEATLRSFVLVETS